MTSPRTEGRPPAPRPGIALLALGLLAAGPAAASGGRPSPDLGPNVVIFDPSMPTSEIQARVDAIAAQQVPDQFGAGRWALLFRPGTYGSAAEPLIIQVGYYTEVAGLGASPGDVVINGHVDVYNQCDAGGCTALVNFWRSVSNLTIAVTGLAGCRASANFWAVSQAAPMRRVDVTGGNLSLMDYCTAGPQFASGGFIADSRTGFVINGSQQQFLVRDSEIGGWSNAVWNQVFAGTIGAPAQSFPSPPYTTLATNPVSRERPYLFADAKGDLRVFVPAPRTGSVGTTWASGPTAGRSLPLATFFVARPSDPVDRLNQALAQGKHLLLTPGVYDVDRSLLVTRPGTLVLGLGFATLSAQGGAVPLVVTGGAADVAGILLDAGPVTSPALLVLGPTIGGGNAPTALQDVFFRVGGPHVGKVRLGMAVLADGALLDDIWSWRADHGSGVGWTVNTADTGVLVAGRDVTATGLFVEHYQKYNVIWSGERGTTIFFQNELPYDPPNQAAWQHDGVLGWAAYKVTDNVKTHTAWGVGCYIFTNVDPTIHASRGFEVPVGPGIAMHDLLTVNLSAGTIDHVVNDTGDPATTAAIGVPSTVVQYP
jgi:hypothetical protein